MASEVKSSGSLPPIPTNGLSNGAAAHLTNGSSAATTSQNGDTADPLRGEVERLTAEKNALSDQYNTLLTKLNTMRTSVANKLKQDAEELDRREQLVQQLTGEVEDLSGTVEMLKAELVASNADAERAAAELDALRARALSQDAHDARALSDALAELEQLRLERDEWERLAEQERMLKDEARDEAEVMRREAELERDARAVLEKELGVDREKAANLQSVLEDFQAAKDHELRQAVRDYETQLSQVTQSLAEYKHRAHTAELKLEESSTDTSRTAELEKEVREKNLLIGKLRHEAVIINEHLNEALRRLRKSTLDRDTNVDRRLVTNILLQFLTAPRGDTKRFEMLKVLSDILSWGDAEREKAGLQRIGAGGGAPEAISRKTSMANGDLEKSDETESFSQMWVEFLLTQADGGDTPPWSPRSTFSSPAPSPRTPLRALSPAALAQVNAASAPPEGRKSSSWIRLPSFGSAPSVRSTSPPLPVPLPSGDLKGKGKERESP